MHAAVRGKLKLQGQTPGCWECWECWRRLKPKGAVPRKAIQATGNSSCRRRAIQGLGSSNDVTMMPRCGHGAAKSASLMGLILCPISPCCPPVASLEVYVCPCILETCNLGFDFIRRVERLSWVSEETWDFRTMLGLLKTMVTFDAWLNVQHYTMAATSGPEWKVIVSMWSVPYRLRCLNIHWWYCSERLRNLCDCGLVNRNRLLKGGLEDELCFSSWPELSFLTHQDVYKSDSRTPPPWTKLLQPPCLLNDDGLFLLNWEPRSLLFPYAVLIRYLLTIIEK